MITWTNNNYQEEHIQDILLQVSQSYIPIQLGYEHNILPKSTSETCSWNIINIDAGVNVVFQNVTSISPDKI